MNTSEIANICLEIVFGNEPKNSLKVFINKALDLGEYYEGFEIAISKKDLDCKEYDELYEAFISAYEKNIPNIEIIKKIVDKNLPQSYFTKTSWLVSNLGEIYITDRLRVAKIFQNNLIWVTKRVSYDGINLLKLTNSKLIGQWFNPTDDDNLWCDLIISTKDGTLLMGEIIEF